MNSIEVVHSGDESLLIRECAGLYASFALEALANFLLGCTFCYLVLLIACKNQLENPGLAVLSWLREHISWAVGDWYRMMRTWQSMPTATLDQRMAFCRKLNLGICITQVAVAFLALTRWLHIGNVNGFRYLGYSITCALMQAELVIMVAPYVPLFKTNVIGVMVVTFATMISGWIGSLQAGFLWEDGSIELFLQSGDLREIAWTTKGYAILPAYICVGIILVLQIPFLALIFVCNGGMQRHRDLPYHFLRLLLLVEVTWPCFGIWWFISADGARVIHDTKSNTIGFCLLNILSKGGFTLMMLKLARDHRQMWIEECVVTPKAQNEDLWIVRQLRPYDPASTSQEEKKYTESDIEAAVARVLAKQSGRILQTESRNDFCMTPKCSRQVSFAAAEGAEDQEPEASVAPVEMSARSQDLQEVMAKPNSTSSNTSEIRRTAVATDASQGWWPCNCETRPPVAVLTLEESARL